MPKATLQVKGLDQLMKRVSRMSDNVKREASEVLLQEATGMEDRAANDAPANNGDLRGAISLEILDPMQYSVAAAKDYAPYVEFGTGKLVQIPSGLEAIAAQYRNGTGNKKLTAKEAIYEWCRKKGIEENLWFPIYRSIMVNGTRPHPFFYHNYFIAVQNIKKRIGQAVEKAMKK